MRDMVQNTVLRKKEASLHMIDKNMTILDVYFQWYKDAGPRLLLIFFIVICSR